MTTRISFSFVLYTELQVTRGSARTQGWSLLELVRYTERMTTRTQVRGASALAKKSTRPRNGTLLEPPRLQ